MSDSVPDKTYAIFNNPGNKKIIADLESSGAKVFAFPPIEAGEISSEENLRVIKENLMDFDWLVFPDVLAVDYFLRILEANETDLFELDALRFCAFGEAVADQLRFSQLHTDVIPNKLDTQAILSALKNYIGTINLAKLKFLILKEKSNKIEIAEKLKLETSEVIELQIYQMKNSDSKEIARMKTLIAGGAIDEFVFTAATDFIALRGVFGGKPLNEIFADVKVSATDGNLYQTLKEHDFKRVGLFRLDKIAKVNE